MPLLHESMLGALGANGQPVKLAGEAHGEIADVNHLLHFTFALGHDFARFQRDKTPKVMLGFAQGIAEVMVGQRVLRFQVDGLAVFGHLFVHLLFHS